MQTTFNTNNIQKILFVRNDKLGDLLVSFSAFAVLKKNLPNTEIHVLVSKYTAPMAKLCKYIDQVIVEPSTYLDSSSNKDKVSFIQKIQHTLELTKQLKEQNYDAIITLFSSLPVALAAFLAKIPIRIAPATKISQIFYNYRITQRRSRSEKPEHRYNQDLSEYLLTLLNISPLQTVTAPFLEFPLEKVKQIKKDFISSHNMAEDSLCVFIHPGTGGSARNLSPMQFAQLANTLTSKHPITIIVSFGPNEEDAAKLVYSNVTHEKVLYESKSGLESFSQHLQFADCFICGSTGPLHIAGVLDRPTAAFYTRRRSATSLRWQTLNSENNRLAFSPPESAEAEDMSSVDIKDAAAKISQQFL